MDLFRQRPAVVAEPARLSAAATDQRPRLSTATPVQTFARERRVELSYDEYPPLVVHAFISAEDKGFFQHQRDRFSPASLGAVFDYTAKSVIGGGRAKGGSTITQQVAKYLLKDSSYNVGRKIREAILAFRLNRR